MPMTWVHGVPGNVQPGNIGGTVGLRLHHPVGSNLASEILCEMGALGSSGPQEQAPALDSLAVLEDHAPELTGFALEARDLLPPESDAHGRQLAHLFLLEPRGTVGQHYEIAA